MALLESLVGNDAKILQERDFQILLLANLVPPLGVAILSPILDSLIGPFGTSPADIGLMIAFFTAPAIVIIPLAGILADRIGRKPILVVSLVVFGLAGTAIAFTTNYQLVLALRLVQGAAFAGLPPIIITSLGDLYDSTAEATAQGIRFSSAGLSNTVFPLFSGVLVGIAWQYPFFLYAMALPIAVVVYVYLEEPADLEGAAVTTADGGEAGVGGEAEESDSSGSGHGNTTDSAGHGNTTGSADRGCDYRAQISALLGLSTRRRVAAIILARGLPQMVWIGFLTYNSIVVVRIVDGTPAQAGLVVAVTSLAFAAAASQAGRVTSIFESRYYPLIGAHVCMGLGFAVFLLSPGLFLATVGIILAGMSFGLTSALYRSIITGFAPESLRGGLVSLSEAYGQLMNTVTPVFMGIVIAVASPQYGLGPAVQMAGLLVAFLVGIGGVALVVAARAAPAVEHGG